MAEKLMEAKDVLFEFVRDIEDTGGIGVNAKGVSYPLGDPTWSDLAQTYRNACNVLGRKPKVRRQDRS